MLGPSRELHIHDIDKTSLPRLRTTNDSEQYTVPQAVFHTISRFPRTGILSLYPIQDSILPAPLICTAFACADVGEDCRILEPPMFLHGLVIAGVSVLRTVRTSRGLVDNLYVTEVVECNSAQDVDD